MMSVEEPRMGKVMQVIKLRNSNDVARANEDGLPSTAIRTAEVEALVDTTATMLVLPADVVAALGVPIQGTRKVRYASGEVAERPWAGNIEIEILGRKTVCTAMVEKAGTTALIGQIPLEELDFLVDPKSRELRVNPASPDAPLIDVLAVA
jgi:aspartyl protease family protein